MAADLAYLEFRLSGGASNSDPTTSLGGLMSSQTLASFDVTGISAITGVTVLDAPNTVPIGLDLGPLTAALAYDAGTTSLTYTGPYTTSGPGDAMNVGTNGRYVLVSGGVEGELLHVDVTAASLPVANQTDTLSIADPALQLFADVSSADAAAGATHYRCVYLYNAHPTDSFTNVQVWATGAVHSVGLDLAGAGDGASTGVADTVADEDTAPDPTVTFLSDTTPAVIGTLAAGEAHAVWVKRVIPSATLAVTFDAVTLGISVDG